MATHEQECQQLRQKITDHDGNIAQMEELVKRTPSAGLKSALDAEIAQRDAARARLFKLEEIMVVETEMQQLQTQIAEQEHNVHLLREEREAVQRRLTQAETDLNRTRIGLNKKQDELQQKQHELNQGAASAAAPAATASALPPRPAAPAAPGGTVRLPQTPPAALRLADGSLEHITTGDAVIGREKMSGIDIALNNETVSGTHARVFFQDNQWTVTDLGSANGTWVGEQKLNPQETTPIQHGAALRFGLIAATFEIVS